MSDTTSHEDLRRMFWAAVSYKQAANVVNDQLASHRDGHWRQMSCIDLQIRVTVMSCFAMELLLKFLLKVTSSLRPKLRCVHDLDKLFAGLPLECRSKMFVLYVSEFERRNGRVGLPNPRPRTNSRDGRGSMGQEDEAEHRSLLLPQDGSSGRAKRRARG